jgi:amino acid adenylation domain-containing protein
LFRFTLIRLSDTDHALIMTFHHIICDGWSLEVLRQDLAELYAAFVEGRPARLPDLEAEYADYVAAQRARLAGDELEGLLNWWRDQLAGAPLRLELPLDYPRPALSSGSGGHVALRFSADTTAAVKSLGRAQCATPFMVLLAAFGTLLGRYTGQEDVVVGCPIAGRTSPEMERLVGLFVNTLPLRVELGGLVTFRELVARVRERALGAYAHQELPFEKLVEAVQPTRVLGERPLAQVLFVLQNTPGTRDSGGGSSIESLRLEGNSSKFDLSLELGEVDGIFEGRLEYDSDLFTESTVERLVDHLRVLLDNALEAPDRPVHELPMLTASERQRALQEWNATESGQPEVSSVHELVEAQVDRTPDTVAVVWRTHELTYRELDERANQLAQYLNRQGIGRGSTVALSLERNFDMLVAVLGVSKAGAAYVPIEPGDPLQRRQQMVVDSRADVLLTHIRSWADLALDGTQIVYLDSPEVQANIADCPATRPASDVGARDPLYVMYTSGSTGTPKGVVVPHKAVMNLLQAVRQAPGLSSADVVLAIAALSFDIAVYDLWAPLACGARIFLAPREAGADAQLLLGLLESSRATVLQATPSTWRLLIQVGWRGKPGLKVISTGESLPKDLADQLAECCDDVWNMYGPTETTVWSTYWQVTRQVGPVLIGRPLANTRVYVLDSHCQLQPEGVPGELYIGGNGVATEYLGQPGLTADRFVLDPFVDDEAARMYGTGDVVRWRPDGQIEYLGRSDQQVKLRGFRIELGEVESTLRRHPDVLDAAAMIREDTPGDRQLVAYVTAPHQSAAPGVATLRAFLGEYLPRYMVPSVIVGLERLPLTANGKVARSALPAPGRELEQAKGHVEPRDDVERTLVDIWQELLGRAPIGVRDNFFDLGGHSLLAARLVFRINALLDHNLPVSSLIQAPTIEQLGELVRAKDTAQLWQPLVELQSGSASQRPIFLVHGAFGDVLCYADLAHELGTGQPCYVLQAIGLDGVSQPLDRVEDMARAYIEQVRAVQPQGPYCLAGYSMGGTIAYEMAQQLQAHGEQIALLGIFDHPPSNGLRARPPAWPVFVGRFTRHLMINIPHWVAMARGVSMRSWPAALRERAYLGRRTLSSMVSARQPGIVHLVDELQRINGLQYLAEWPAYRRRVLELQHEAMYAYKPRAYAGGITLFRARRQPLMSPHDPSLGWADLVQGQIEVVEVKGNHNGILRYPQVRTLAAHLRPLLQTMPVVPGGT